MLNCKKTRLRVEEQHTSHHKNTLILALGVPGEHKFPTCPNSGSDWPGSYLLSVESKLIHVIALSPWACENSKTERPVSKSHTFITCKQKEQVLLSRFLRSCVKRRRQYPIITQGGGKEVRLHKKDNYRFWSCSTLRQTAASLPGKIHCTPLCYIRFLGSKKGTVLNTILELRVKDFQESYQ